MKKLKLQIKSTIQNNKHIINFILILFLIGIILGSLFMILISKDDQSYVIKQISQYFYNIKKGSSQVLGITFFKNDMFNNMFQLFLIYALGLSIIGVLVVIFIMILKGFILGVTISGIFIKYKISGVIGVVLYIFPIYFLKILLYVFSSLFAITTSIKFIKAIIKKDQLNFKTFLGTYTMSFIISILGMIVLSLLDSYLTPFLLKLFTFL